MAGLEVSSVGAATLVQDLGRHGLTRWGVARSGAADRAALRLANRLVGNPEDLAGLECLMGGLELATDTAAVVAVTGARCAVSVDGVGRGQDVAVRVEPGQRLALGRCGPGLRSYVAVRGGIDVPAVLRSRSYDSLGEIGPPPLQPGDTVAIGPTEACQEAWFEQAPVASPSGEALVRVVLGPRDDWFEPEAVEAFLSTGWQLSGDSNRVGLRLEGPELTRRAGDLPSEPVLPGAVQVPASGQPIILGPDSGTTGGYPVIAVVHDEDLDQLGQLSPGEIVRFRLG